jgi:hypothetical protein
MPKPILSDKYKDKSFGEISNEIQEKYKDRFDPISQRGLQAEMGVLREEQEYRREKEAIKQELEMLLEQQKQQQAQQMVPEQQVDPTGFGMQNQGVVPEMSMEDPSGQFAHNASQSYNQQFAYGGKMDYALAGQFDDPDYLTQLVNQGRPGIDTSLNFSKPQLRMNREFNKNIYSPQTPTGGQGEGFTGLNPMRYAPILGNIANLAMARKAQPIGQRMQDAGYRTQIDENLATRTAPRQAQFSNVDMGQIERGIHQQGRGFTAANRGASGGNAGAFMANELGNQSNIMNAIGQARMQGQLQDRQTQGMNAQEQARIDAIKQGQAQMQAGIQGQNINTGMNILNIDDANQGAFKANQMANIAGIFENIGTAGRDSDIMKTVMAGTNYGMFGDYSESGNRISFLEQMLKQFSNKKR